MKNIFYVFITLFLITACSSGTTTQTKVCDCCNRTFTNIDSALICISNNPSKHSPIDERQFLIAFVHSYNPAYQNPGWNILSDQDIMNIAKQNYLLIILNVKDIHKFKVKPQPELMQIMTKHVEDDSFFVITNQMLYPVADWTNLENKSTIIDRLKVGVGP